MPGLYTGASGLWGGFTGLLFGSTSLSTPPGLLADAAGFSPLSLFASGEPGVWYDPSDLTTLFRDAAGTTPVTAMEQPVGLVLDKSKGLTLGRELVTNGDFSSATGWVLFGTGASIGSGVLTINNGGVSGGAQQGAIASGKWYRVTFTATVRSGVGRIILGGYSLDVTTKTFNASGTYTWYLQSSGTSVLIERHSGVPDFDVDNISVRELPGNHASQSTAASRPVVSARYNLLTYTEQFDNAAWFKEAGSITATTVTAPDGTSTADTFSENSATNNHGFYYNSGTVVPAAECIARIYVKPLGRSIVRFQVAGAGSRAGATFNLTTGAATDVTAGYTPSATLHPSGFWLLQLTVTFAASTIYFGVRSSDGATTAVAGINGAAFDVWGADLRVSNDGVGLPAYQRVGAATAGSSTAAGDADYDTSGFPVYLRFDGTDDSLATAAIDFSATDKMSVFAGVRRLADTVNFIVELSANAGIMSGTMYIGSSAVAASDYLFYLRGTSGIAGYYGPTGFSSPRTDVLTALFDIGGASLATEVIPRVDTVVSQSGASGTAGTGNFSSNPLYIGSRAGTSNRLNGRLYSLIVLGRTATATEITSTETWINSKSKAF